MSQERRRVNHEFFYAPTELLRADPHSWFYTYGLTVPQVIFSLPDIRAARVLLSSMLLEAWDREQFFEENKYSDPVPHELDRMIHIAWLQQIGSFTGLLNGEEIRAIQKNEGSLPLNDFILPNRDAMSFTDLVSLTTKWKSEGQRIGLFHGSFDPPTVAHLSCATEAYTQCDRLLIGFDSDEMLRARKGNERPRFPLPLRQEIFNSFWMVDGVFTLRVGGVDDVEQFIADYQDLGIDTVFLSAGQEDAEARLNKIIRAGAQPAQLTFRVNEFNATRMMEMARQWGFV